MKNSQKLLKAISAFTLTSVLLILVYYIGAIYPFGDHALFKWDMELQYIDFFHWWHRVLHGQGKHELFPFQITGGQCNRPDSLLPFQSI